MKVGIGREGGRNGWDEDICEGGIGLEMPVRALVDSHIRIYSLI